jgi:hypothetical protein
VKTSGSISSTLINNVTMCCHQMNVQVLQDSLCGSSKVLLVCNLSPEPASCSETLSSLNFASRAAQVELGQARRVQTAAAAAAGSSNLGADLIVDLAGVAGSSNVRAADAISPAQASSRASTPSPTKSSGSLRASWSSGMLHGAVAAGSNSNVVMAGIKPASRLSERPAAAVVSNGTAASPKSAILSKPARH